MNAIEFSHIAALAYSSHF